MSLPYMDEDDTVTEYRLTLETTDPPTTGLPEFVTVQVRREGTHMIAQCREYDIVAQANDANGALIELNRLILLRGIVAEEKGVEPFANLSPPPKYDPGYTTQCITVEGYTYDRTRWNNKTQEKNDSRHYQLRSGSGGSPTSDVICGMCLNDSFHITYGNYECIAVCTRCGNSDCVYDG
jgi:hypothetical protein